MRIACALVVLACACGRVGFDARGMAIDADGDAASGDAGMPCGAIDAVVPHNGVIGLAWTGSSYLMLTLDGLFAIDSVTGALGAAQTVSPAEGIEYGGQQGIAWTGSEAALVWLSGTGALELGITDATGAMPVASQQLASGAAIDPHVVWTGSDFVVAWVDTSMGRVLFDEITAGGVITHNGDIFQDGSAIVALYALDCDTAHCVAGIYHSAAQGPSLVVEPLPLGGISAENGLMLPTSGTYLQLVPTGSGGLAMETSASGAALQAYDASDLAAGSVFGIPETMGQTIAFVTGVPTGTGARVFAVSAGAPTYTFAVDYTPSTMQFDLPMQLDAVTTSSVSVPAIARGPGRVLFAVPFSDGTGNHIVLRQLCM